ncbi:Alpha/Beta hydrolase protein [Biscogniauxia sp. FL1348]|nr:Alpha/Beta hydrolase protein [Biscogniauxia sp. FL1348]
MDTRSSVGRKHAQQTTAPQVKVDSPQSASLNTQAPRCGRRTYNHVGPGPGPAQFQPAGYLSPPPGWNPGPPPPPLPNHYQDQRQYPPIIVNQHYYLGPPSYNHPANPYPSNNGLSALSRFKLGSTAELMQIPSDVVNQIFDDGLPRWHGYGSQLLNQSAAMYDQICDKFNDVMTLIDRDRFVGNENDLFMYQAPTETPPPPPPVESSKQVSTSRKGHGKKSKKDAPKGQTSAVATSIISAGYFSKVDLYANSKLPLDLLPLRLDFNVYPLLSLAARYSERVYEKPRGPERDAHIDANWKTGAKAMYIKSVSMDHMDTIVFAIRGTATFMDWAVNLNTAPTAPTGFLDDASNFCHAGFLSTARKMIAPVAARLRQLLQEDPRRCAYSLLIAGHSAGGAVASLLYMHMLATSKAAASELNHLTGCFKRVHCITFGAPPVSLLPLQKPPVPELKRSQFLSFVNEGDPVARADKAYVKSLLELFAAPVPAPGGVQSKEAAAPSSLTPLPPPPPSSSKHSGGSSSSSKPREKKSKSSLASKTSKTSMKSTHSHASPKSSKSKQQAPPPLPGPVWKVPESTLSNAGRIVVLRSGSPHAKVKRAKTVEERLGEGVVAQVASDEQLRGVVWGDPVCHVMRLYAGRVEELAIRAATAKGY